MVLIGVSPSLTGERGGGGAWPVLWWKNGRAYRSCGGGMAYQLNHTSSLKSHMPRQYSALVNPHCLGGCNRGTQTLDSMGCSDFLIWKTFLLSVGCLRNSADTKFHMFFYFRICHMPFGINQNSAYLYEISCTLFTKISRNSPEFHDIFTCGIVIFHPKTGGGGLLRSSFQIPTSTSKHVSWGLFLTNKWSSSLHF